MSCEKPSCDSVYIGQSQDIPVRLGQHTSSKTCPSLKYYVSAKHANLRDGHNTISSTCLVPYRSNSLFHRLAIETSLISSCKTIKGNKTSSCNKDMNILAPIILRAANIDWKIIAEAQPKFNSDIAPRKYRIFFSNQDGNVSALPTQDAEPPDDQPAIEELLAVTSPIHHLRPRN